MNNLKNCPCILMVMKTEPHRFSIYKFGVEPNSYSNTVSTRKERSKISCSKQIVAETSLVGLFSKLFHWAMFSRKNCEEFHFVHQPPNDVLNIQVRFQPTSKTCGNDLTTSKVRGPSLPGSADESIQTWSQNCSSIMLV